MTISGLVGPGIPAPVDLSIGQREVVALFGLVGGGASDLLRLIDGVVPPAGGNVVLDAATPPGCATMARVLLWPANQTDEAARAPLPSQTDAAMWRRIGFAPLLRRGAGADSARAAIARMRGIAAGADAALHTRSGDDGLEGLSRQLTHDAPVLLLDEPTRGMDGLARRAVHHDMRRFAERGRAVLFTSSDPGEAIAVADRIVVMAAGRVTGIVDRAGASVEALLRLALPRRDMGPPGEP